MINKITIIAVSEKGKELAERISRHYDEVTISRLAEVEKAFSCSDALIFIGALGICVRSIAPYIQSGSFLHPPQNGKKLPRIEERIPARKRYAVQQRVGFNLSYKVFYPFRSQRIPCFRIP